MFLLIGIALYTCLKGILFMCYKKLMKMVAQATGQIYFVNKRLRKKFSCACYGLFN